MATNIVRIDTSPSHQNAYTVSHPASPVSGDPVLIGTAITGIALTSEGEGQNIATQTSCHTGSFVARFSVAGQGVAAPAAIPQYGRVYYDQAATPVLNADSTNGVFFGFALQAVGSGLTATIEVLHVEPS